MEKLKTVLGLVLVIAILFVKCAGNQNIESTKTEIHSSALSGKMKAAQIFRFTSDSVSQSHSSEIKLLENSKATIPQASSENREL